MNWAESLWKAMLASPHPVRIEDAELTDRATGRKVRAAVMNTAALKARL